MPTTDKTVRGLRISNSLSNCSTNSEGSDVSICVTSKEPFSSSSLGTNDDRGPNTAGSNSKLVEEDEGYGDDSTASCSYDSSFKSPVDSSHWMGKENARKLFVANRPPVTTVTLSKSEPLVQQVSVSASRTKSLVPGTGPDWADIHPAFRIFSSESPCSGTPSGPQPTNNTASTGSPFSSKMMMPSDFSTGKENEEIPFPDTSPVGTQSTQSYQDLTGCDPPVVNLPDIITTNNEAQELTVHTEDHPSSDDINIEITSFDIPVLPYSPYIPPMKNSNTPPSTKLLISSKKPSPLHIQAMFSERYVRLYHDYVDLTRNLDLAKASLGNSFKEPVCLTLAVDETSSSPPDYDIDGGGYDYGEEPFWMGREKAWKEVREFTARRELCELNFKDAIVELQQATKVAESRGGWG